MFCCTGGLLHELSNQGAQLQMNTFLEEKLLPQMVACSQVVSNYDYNYCTADGGFVHRNNSRIIGHV